MKRPFGLSVLTHRQAAAIMPAAQTQTKLNEVKTVMEKKGTDATVAANVLQWQRKHARRQS